METIYVLADSPNNSVMNGPDVEIPDGYMIVTAPRPLSKLWMDDSGVQSCIHWENWNGGYNGFYVAGPPDALIHPNRTLLRSWQADDAKSVLLVDDEYLTDRLLHNDYFKGDQVLFDVALEAYTLHELAKTNRMNLWIPK